MHVDRTTLADSFCGHLIYTGMGKETFYFSHDYNARSDRKLVNVIMIHGMEGIGVYWCLVEMLYEEGGYIPHEYERIAFDLRTNTDIIQSVITEFDLFEIDEKNFWSKAVLYRLEKRCEKSEKARESINQRWSKNRNTPVIRTNKKRITIKESKGKENKVFIPPTFEEVKLYFIENNYSDIAAKKAFEHYDLANWHDTNGKPVINWKQKMHTVWFKEENKIKINKPIIPIHSNSEQLKVIPGWTYR